MWGKNQPLHEGEIQRLGGDTPMNNAEKNSRSNTVHNAEKLRGRPRSQLKNQSILQAASDLFMEKGFDGTSMDEVAKRAGVSKQTVYSHFSSKEQLFSASISRVIHDYFPESACEDDVIHTVEGDLRQICEQFTRLLVSEDAISMFRLLATAASTEGGNTLARLFWEAGPEEMIDRLSRFLAGWAEKGELQITDPAEAAITLISLIKGQYHFKLAIGLDMTISEEIIQNHAQRCADLFLKIYR